MSKASYRFELGQERFSSLITYWVKASHLSLRQFCTISNWAIGEPNWLGSGILSHIMRGNMQKVSLRYLDVFAETNQALWTWKVKGKEEAWKHRGPHSVWDIKTHWLDDAIWLPSPKSSKDPLELGDFTCVLAGYIDIPYAKVKLTPNEHIQLASEISGLLNSIVAKSNLSPKQALQVLAAAYPNINQSRYTFLSNLLLGMGKTSSEELKKELPNIAAMISKLREVDPNQYGPSELRAELMLARRRS